MKITKTQLQTGTTGLGNVAGLVVALRAGKGFWPCVGYLVAGGLIGGALGTAAGAVAGLEDEAKPAQAPQTLLPNLRSLVAAQGAKGKPVVVQEKLAKLSGIPTGPGPYPLHDA